MQHPFATHCALLALLTTAPGAWATQYLYVGTGDGSPGAVWVFSDLDQDGVYETTVQEVPVLGGAKSGARVATGDFDGDNNLELVVATGPKGGGAIEVYDINPDGSLGGMQESFAPFGAGFGAGLFVAAGDLDNDGRDELLVSSGKKSESRVQVYTDADSDGLLGDGLVDDFTPFAGFDGGVTIALGDVDNDGRDDLVAGHGPGGESRVLIIADTNGNRLLSDEAVLDEFDAFDEKYKGGVFVASTGSIASFGGGGDEVIVGAAKKLTEVRIFTDEDNDGLVSDHPVRQTIVAYEGKSKGGVRVAAGDTDNSGSLVEVITVPGQGPLPVLKIFDDGVDAGSDLDETPEDEFLVTAGKAKGGLFVATGRFNMKAHAMNSNALSIPDDGAGGDVLDASIFLPPGTGIVRDLDVWLAIEHTFNADLDATLTHVPTGTSIALFTDVGSNDDGMFVRLSDEAGTDIGTAGDDPNDKPLVGDFNPEGGALLSTFDNLDASGEWRLSIDDDFAGISGRLQTWTLFVDAD